MNEILVRTKKSAPSRAIPPTKVLADSVGRFPWEGAAQPIGLQQKKVANRVALHF